MLTHVKILGWLHIIFGFFGLCLALLVFGGTMVGALFSGSFGGMLGAGVLGGFAATFVALLSIPGILVGYGLLTLKSWARILAIIVAIFELIHFPFGTALAIYTFWVMFNSETVAIFDRRSRAST